MLFCSCTHVFGNSASLQAQNGIFNFSQDDIQDFRVRIACDLVDLMVD